MTVDELHEVLKDRLDILQTGVDRINGRVSKHGEDITALKIRDAYVAGGLTVLVIAWESIRRRIGW